MSVRPGTIAPPSDGFFYDMPYDEYRALDAWNISLLKYCRRTMERVRAECLDPTPIGADTEFKGKLFHVTLLEPEKEKALYAVEPKTYPLIGKTDGAVGSISKGGKVYCYGAGRGANREEWEIAPVWDDDAMAYVTRDPLPDGVELIESSWNALATYCKAWKAEQGSKEVVKAPVLDAARKRAARIRELPDAQKLFDGAQFEVSIVWTDPQTGLRCKGRLDLYNESLNHAIGDGKSTQNPADYENFARTMRRYHYCEQAAFYRDGVNILLAKDGREVPQMGTFTWLVSEDAKPFTPAVYTIMDTGYEGSGPYFVHGRCGYHGWLQQVAHALKNDFWPGLNPGPGGLTEDRELPPMDFWALDGMEN